MNLDELDKQGKTNSSVFLNSCKKYHNASRQYSFNTGDIKSINDITENLRRAIGIEESRRERDMDALIQAINHDDEA